MSAYKLIGDNNKEVTVLPANGKWKAVVPLSRAEDLIREGKAYPSDNVTIIKRDSINTEKAFIENYIKVRDNNICVDCKGKSKSLFKKYPKVLGGKFSPSNVISLCEPCLRVRVKEQQLEYPIIVNSELINRYKQTKDASLIKRVNIKGEDKVRQVKEKAKLTQQLSHSQTLSICESDSSYSIRSHAFKRVKERSSLKSCTKEEAKEYCLKIIKEGEHIGLVMGDDGKLNDTYILNNEKVHVRENEIITYVQKESLVYTPIKSKLFKVYKSELNRLKKLCCSREKYLENIKLEAEVEIAEMKLLIHRARSEAKILAYKGRIKGIEITIKEYEQELMQIYKDKSRVTGLVMGAAL